MIFKFTPIPFPILTGSRIVCLPLNHKQLILCTYRHPLLLGKRKLNLIFPSNASQEYLPVTTTTFAVLQVNTLWLLDDLSFGCIWRCPTLTADNPI